MVLTHDGLWERQTWTDGTQSWRVFVTVQMDPCDSYAQCGAYGSCNAIDLKCGCLKGFVPKYQNVRDTDNRSYGYVRRTPLKCKSDGFLNYSCTAYSNLDIRNGGSGCMLWFVDLIDIQQFSANGQYLYVRMVASELELGTFVPKSSFSAKDQKEGLELPSFDLAATVLATDNFSLKNKLGQGGFGTGVLKDGREIAVKRSGGGLDEFKNEVIHLAKLQHRNLVKLLGCCIQADEKIL
ncbi:hypothetical protein Goari_027128, partial [Gossypium aridum]|nr:hypothetical protein [Gossypium aridum]